MDCHSLLGCLEYSTNLWVQYIDSCRGKYGVTCVHALRTPADQLATLYGGIDALACASNGEVDDIQCPSK